jgi:hypothetical protein
MCAMPTADSDLGPISPELVLVDPELARVARALLVAPPPPPRAAAAETASEPVTLAAIARRVAELERRAVMPNTPVPPAALPGRDISGREVGRDAAPVVATPAPRPLRHVAAKERTRLPRRPRATRLRRALMATSAIFFLSPVGLSIARELTPRDRPHLAVEVASAQTVSPNTRGGRADRAHGLAQALPGQSAPAVKHASVTAAARTRAERGARPRASEHVSTDAPGGPPAPNTPAVGSPPPPTAPDITVGVPWLLLPAAAGGPGDVPPSP